jgi:cobalt/nickel transport system permease protein
MLCRGYGRHSFLYVRKKTLERSDLAFLSLSMIFVIAVPVAVWLTRFALL